MSVDSNSVAASAGRSAARPAAEGLQAIRLAVLGSRRFITLFRAFPIKRYQAQNPKEICAAFDRLLSARPYVLLLTQSCYQTLATAGLLARPELPLFCTLPDPPAVSATSAALMLNSASQRIRTLVVEATGMSAGLAPSTPVSATNSTADAAHARQANDSQQKDLS